MNKWNNRERNQKIYQSKEWQDLRTYQLELNPFCTRCKTKGVIKSAQAIHHIIEINDNWELRLDINNLESLCTRCHNTHSRQEQINKSKKHKNKNLDKLKELAGIN